MRIFKYSLNSKVQPSRSCPSQSTRIDSRCWLFINPGDDKPWRSFLKTPTHRHIPHIKHNGSYVQKKLRNERRRRATSSQPTIDGLSREYYVAFSCLTAFQSNFLTVCGCWLAGWLTAQLHLFLLTAFHLLLSRLKDFTSLQSNYLLTRLHSRSCWILLMLLQSSSVFCVLFFKCFTIVVRSRSSNLLQLKVIISLLSLKQKLYIFNSQVFYKWKKFPRNKQVID